MASTFNIETLLKVQTFDFKHNISANFKAWICATHPEYIRTSLSNKIAPNDLNKFKDKYEYEKRKRDPTAPWHNFVQTLPKLIRETTEHAQQLDKEPLTLQQKYDALLKEHCDLVEKDSLSQRKILKITTQLQDTTQVCIKRTQLLQKDVEIDDLSCHNETISSWQGTLSFSKHPN